MTDAPAAIAELIEIMARLRHPETGCPWDQVQDFASIAPYTIEEAYEVEDAIAKGEPAVLMDELGDLLFQVVYHARMAEERGWFAFHDVAKAISDKMIRRHPHVFGEAAARTAEGQVGAWEVQKAAERAARAETGTLAGIPARLPALTRAAKLTRRAGRVGFDWPDAASVLDKLEEEAAELRAELSNEQQAADHEAIKDEVGDLLFVLANLARKLDLDPEDCLRGANRKFERRFGFIEQKLLFEGKSPADSTLDRMEELWRAAKHHERSGR
ncbi:nucleoside triphosphate pyrophosphohydrolase [Roseomonas terrae]|uniref:Nucleoside triphosphate pyrophosphohydrolase n=1 Tax=Neoroseomonas terrae TaxID=424799 RepID=A0ABS5ELH8_9PROT|nr:nucleoside triphosphate pyrophosphohydrolase [Neoroseomonas terrae]MBR0651884.1 nucleoside triphosphate pyrophosphohydrolase [Neoroseomonas terrae]